MTCIQCSKKVSPMKIKDPTDGQYYLIKSICQDCIFEMGEMLHKGDKPLFTCTRCNQGAHVLRNSECKTCYEQNQTLVASLPVVEPIDPPLGYSLIGLDEKDAKQEVEYAYAMTPFKGELPN